MRWLRSFRIHRVAAVALGRAAPLLTMWGDSEMSVQLLHPSSVRWRVFIEREAIRIFGGLAGSTRSKVEKQLLADNIARGIPRDVAERDVAEAMALLDARLDLYAQARAIEPIAILRGRAG
jgi:hypothetical protein